MAELSANLIQKYNKKTVPQLLKLCQQTFNKYIRQRDSDLPCISCQKGRVENAGQYIWKERQRWNRIKTKWVSIRHTGYRDFYIEYTSKYYNPK